MAFELELENEYMPKIKVIGVGGGGGQGDFTLPCAIGVAQHLNGGAVEHGSHVAAHLAFEPLECAAAAADGGQADDVGRRVAAVEADVFVGFAVIAGLAVLAFVHSGKTAAQ